MVDINTIYKIIIFHHLLSPSHSHYTYKHMHTNINRYSTYSKLETLRTIESHWQNWVFITLMLTCFSVCVCEAEWGGEDMVMGRHVVLMLQDGVGIQMEGEVETMTGPFLSLSVSVGGWAEPSLSVLPQRYLILCLSLFLSLSSSLHHTFPGPDSLSTRPQSCIQL